MVIVKLYGGLGNQMFQYAAGLALAKKNKAHLYMDLSWFDEIKGNPNVTQRVYELDGFCIQPNSMTVNDRLSLRFNHPKVFKEESLSYQPEFQKLKGNIILDGYWQSYKYFEGYRLPVLKAFSFPAKISGTNKKILASIENSQSISVHVRRGDYIPKVGRSYHGLLPLSYYHAAVADIKKRIKEPLLFIFSDDIDWCKKNIKFDLPGTYIDSNSPNVGVEDMRLMSACKHNIIANSSFSWWAAWLNKNIDKEIHAPHDWFKAVNSDLSDRLPKEWRII